MPAPARSAPARRVKLAILPSESDVHPKLADSMNGILRDAKARGVHEYVRPKVTLEVAQLSVECIEPSNSCYTAVGQSMTVNRLLFAQIEAPSARSVRVTVNLFDVDGGAPIKKVARDFATETEAADSLKLLVDEALEGDGGG